MAQVIHNYRFSLAAGTRSAIRHWFWKQDCSRLDALRWLITHTRWED